MSVVAGRCRRRALSRRRSASSCRQGIVLQARVVSLHALVEQVTNEHDQTELTGVAA